MRLYRILFFTSVLTFYSIATHAAGSAYINMTGGVLESNGKRSYVQFTNGGSGDFYFPTSSNYPSGKTYFSIIVRVYAVTTANYYLRGESLTGGWNAFFSPQFQYTYESAPVNITAGNFHDFTLRVSVPIGTSSQSMLLRVYEDVTLLPDPSVGGDRYYTFKTDAQIPIFSSFNGGSGIGIYNGSSQYPFDIPSKIDQTSFTVVSGGGDVNGNMSGLWKAELEGATNTGYVISNTGAWSAITPFTLDGGGTASTAFPGIRGNTYFFRVRLYDNVGNNILSYERSVYINKPPTLTTIPPNIIGSTSASSGGNIISNGGSPVTNRGICWGTTVNPTVSLNNNFVDLGAGGDVFAYTINGLTPGITYHVRAFAVNSVDIAYGQDYSFAMPKLNQTIIFNTLPSKTFGDPSFSLSATTSSGLSISYSSSNTSVATVSGSTVTVIGAGSAIITASQAGNSNYNAATNVQQTLTVNKASQSITFNALAGKTGGC